jgi:uncharacterized membrane protein
MWKKKSSQESYKMNKKKYINLELVIFFILIIPFIVILIKWNAIPDKIYVSWGDEHNSIMYVGKAIGLFALPVLNVFFYFLFFVLPRMAKREYEGGLFNFPYSALRLGIAHFILLIFYSQILYTVNSYMSIPKILLFAAIQIISVLGYLLPNIKEDSRWGLRLRGTLANPEVWRLTHLNSGRVFIWASMVILFMSFIFEMNIMKIVYLGYIIILVLFPIVYSWWKVRNKNSSDDLESSDE